METRKQATKDKFTWHNALQTSGNNRACVNKQLLDPLILPKTADITAPSWLQQPLLELGKTRSNCCRYQTGHHWDKLQLMRMQRNLHTKKLQSSKTMSTVITLWESRTKCQTIITFITKSSHKLPWLLHHWFHQFLTVAVILGKQFPQHLPESCQQSWVCLVSGSDRKTTVATITDESNTIPRRHTREHTPQRRGETERESMQIDTKLQASP